MALTLGQRKLETKTSSKFVKTRAHGDVHICGTALVVGCSVTVLLFCFVFLDMRNFIPKSANPVYLQFGLGPDPISSRDSQEGVSLKEAPPTHVNAKASGIRASGEDSEDSETSKAVRELVTSTSRDSALKGFNPDKEADKVSSGLVGSEDVEALTLEKENLETFKVRESASKIPASEVERDGIGDSPTSKARNSHSDLLLMPGGNQTATKTLAECNLSQGRWVYDDSYPLYRTKNCPFADDGFRCEENGRPDLQYMKYRWQPHDCDMPRFNATDMLERLRGQRMVFVGDSLGRNHWESMMCMLAEAVSDKTRIYEMHGNPITKHQGALKFRFRDYNCTVEYYRDPFLIPQGRPPRNSPKNVTCSLKVDHICWSAGSWKDANILVFNAGHWWSEHKIFRQGCKFQEGEHLKNYTLETGFKKALRSWGRWMDENVDPLKTQVFFRSFASVHFRGGAWNKGGHCDKEVKPLTEEEAQAEWQTYWTNQIIEDEIKNHVKKKDSVTYMDITTATNYRSDGHGALFHTDNKKFGPVPRNHQDCSHFCLPGVPDMWNELLYASLLAKGRGNWGLPVRI